MPDCWMSSFDSSRGKMTKVNQMWNVQFAPTSLDEVAVHKSKIAQLEETLKHKLMCRSSPFLLLIGPPGCGKATILGLVAKKLRTSIQEWVNPASANESDSTNWTNALESQATQFSEFLFRVNRYRSLNFCNFTENENRIFLVKDFPNAFMRDPVKFFNVVKSYAALPKMVPCVFIITDNAGSSNPKRTLFPDGFIKEAQIDVLKFNSIAQGAMLKALQNIITKVSNNSKSNFKLPTKEDIQGIVEASNGDIRSSVNSLQFICLNHLKKSHRFDGNLGKKKIFKNVKPDKEATFEKEFSIGIKEKNLSLFRVLGKILHNKRCPDFSPTENKLPHQFHHHKRTLLSFDPDAMFDKSCLGVDAYLASLHHNYISFTNNIEQLSEASDYLSEADTFMCSWSVRPSLTACQASLVTRGIAFSLSNPDKVGWKPLYKPTMLDLFSKVSKTKDELLQHFYLLCSSTSKLALEMLPFHINIGCHDFDKEQYNTALKVVKFESNIKFQHEKLEDTDKLEHKQQYMEDFHFLSSMSSETSHKAGNSSHSGVDNEDFYIEDSND